MKNPIVGAVFLLLTCAAFAQSSSSGKLSFEVASIKPAAPPQMGMMRVGMTADAGMLRYINVSLRDLIRTAYRVKDFQINGPDWLGSTRYDVVAKFPAGATKDQVPEMLQSLLIERFKLTLYSDTKEHAIYALVIGKNGPKLKPAEVQTGEGSPALDKAAGALQAADGGMVTKGVPGGGPGSPGGPGAVTAKAAPRGPSGPQRGGMLMMMIDPSGLHLKANAATLASLADSISRFTERPVVDMTGIKGQYDFGLVFTPERMPMPSGAAMAGPPPGAESQPGPDAANEPGASIFDAVQRYGLKLEPRKAALEILIIDHIEKTPTEN